MKVLVSIITITLLLPGFAASARGDCVVDFVRYRSDPGLHQISISYENVRGTNAVDSFLAKRAQHEKNGIYLASAATSEGPILRVKEDNLNGQTFRTVICIYPPRWEGELGCVPDVFISLFVDGNLKVDSRLGRDSFGEVVGYSPRIIVNTDDRTISQDWHNADSEFSSTYLCYDISPADLLLYGRSGPQTTNESTQSFITFGEVILMKQGGRMQFITPRTAFTIGSRDPMMETLHAVNSPFVELTGMDGVVADGPGVVPIDAGKPLDGGAFTRFAFFTERKTSVGVLWGMAGASGGSSQTLVVCDTETGQHVAMKMVDMCTPIWLDKSSRPPPYAETTTTPYLGAHALSLGFAPRVHKAYTFDPWRLAYERDPLVEVALCAQRFGQVQLEAADTATFREKGIWDVDRARGVKLVDFVYYGVRSGAKSAVADYVVRLPESYRKEIVSAYASIEPPPTNCPTVFAALGNIYARTPDEGYRQLTEKGVDFDPDLSPDGRLIAFVRRTPGHWIPAGSGSKEDGSTTNEIWLMDRNGRNKRRVVVGRKGTKTQHVLSALRRPLFSPDGRLLYFMSAEWATEAATHVLEIDTGRTRFVAPGMLMEVVQKGKYAGHIIANQHRYFLGCGSYDWDWLLSPDGERVGPVGDSPAQRQMFRELHAR